MALTIKAYLAKEAGSQPEIRRFGVPPDVTSFNLVRQRVKEAFPSLHNKDFSLQWTGESFFKIANIYILQLYHYHQPQLNILVLFKDIVVNWLLSDKYMYL